MENMENIFATFGLVALFIEVCAVFTLYLIDRIRQRRIIARRKRISEENILKDTRHDPETTPITVSKMMLRQDNQGPDPYDRKYPSIKVRSYGKGCELVSAEKGIW